MLTLFGKIAEHILGHKYYSVTYEELFSDKVDDVPPRHLGGYIFRTRSQAERYRKQLQSARTIEPIEIISFRSKTYYKPFDNNYNVDIR